MRHKRSRDLPVGLSAAVGAFAAAAMMSAATAPTAHADDYSAIIADIQAEETAAATALATASTDFGNGDSPDGLTQLFIGLDDDLVGVPNDLEVGTVDVLTGATVIPAVPKPGHLLHLPLSRNSSWVRRFRCKAPLTG